MTDRNTISQVIESLFEDWIDKNINVHPLAVENMRILEADALELLKEQEAVGPKSHPAKAWTRAKTLWFCGACGARISKRKTKYCQECGTAVKWT